MIHGTYNTSDNTRQRQTSMLLRACTLLICMASIVCGTASADTITVCSSGCNYTTIQAAVNAASSGDTVYVYNGSYTENIDISTASLTLEGEGRDDVTVTAASAYDPVFKVTADYVNISGFHVTGATTYLEAGIYLFIGTDHCNIFDNSASDNYYGIRLYGSSSNTLRNNILNSNRGNGIHLCYSSNNNRLQGNSANSNTNRGIRLCYSSNHNTLEYNTANSNGERGIWLVSSNHNTLEYNTASDNDNCGIHLEYSSNNMFTGNTANSNGGDGISLFDSSENMFTGNTANSNGGNGISLWDSSNYNTFTGNTANSNGWYGIYLSSSGNNVITCNWVQNNERKGFCIEDGSTDNNINNNNIIANGEQQSDGSYHYQFLLHNQNEDVDATDNWWGTNDNAIINKSIYDGYDNPSLGNVTFLPKLDGPDPCSPIPELSTIVLFTVGLLTLVGYVRIGRKK